MRRGAGFVYFIKPVGMPGPIKIGCSFMPEKRLADIAAWSPWPLEIVVTIPGDATLERNIHECLAHHHSHKEWFHAHPDILRLTERLRAGSSIADALDLSDRRGNILSPLYRNKVTPRTRKLMKYRMRLYWAERKLGESAKGNFWPLDVTGIMHRWGMSKDSSPTDAEFARLEEVLANPAAHRITHEERFPKLRAVS